METSKKQLAISQGLFLKSRTPRSPLNWKRKAARRINGGQRIEVSEMVSFLTHASIFPRTLTPVILSEAPEQSKGHVPERREVEGPPRPVLHKGASRRSLENSLTLHFFCKLSRGPSTRPPPAKRDSGSL